MRSIDTYPPYTLSSSIMRFLLAHLLTLPSACWCFLPLPLLLLLFPLLLPLPSPLPLPLPLLLLPVLAAPLPDPVAVADTLAAPVAAGVWTAAALETTDRLSSDETAARFFTASSVPAFWFAFTAAGKSFWSCLTWSSTPSRVAAVSISEGVNTLESVSTCWTAKQPPAGGRGVSCGSFSLHS